MATVAPSVEERQLLEAVAAATLHGQVDEGDVVGARDEAESAGHDEDETLEAGDRHGRYHDPSRQQHCRTRPDTVGENAAVTDLRDLGLFTFTCQNQVISGVRDKFFTRLASSRNAQHGKKWKRILRGRLIIISTRKHSSISGPYDQDHGEHAILTSLTQSDEHEHEGADDHLLVVPDLGMRPPVVPL